MIDPGELREGMTVRDLEGRRLGTVANLGDTYFELEQGWPARRDFAVNYHLVERVQGVNNDWDFPRWRRLKRFAFLTGDFQWLQFVLVCRPAGGSGESAE